MEAVQSIQKNNYIRPTCVEQGNIVEVTQEVVNNQYGSKEAIVVEREGPGCDAKFSCSYS